MNHDFRQENSQNNTFMVLQIAKPIQIWQQKTWSISCTHQIWTFFCVRNMDSYFSCLRGSSKPLIKRAQIRAHKTTNRAHNHLKLDVKAQVFAMKMRP